MFESSRPFLVFDYLRVPYRAVPPERLWAGAALPERHPLRAFGWLRRAGSPQPSAALCWPSFSPAGAPLGAAARLGHHRLGSIPIHGHVLPDAAVGPWLSQTGRRWARPSAIHDARGRRVASVWRADDGTILLPFDPDEIVRNYWSEGYQTIGERACAATVRRAAVAAYYRVRPLLPRPAQIRLRRLFSRVQARSRFPRWPVETALHDFQAHVLQTAAALAREPVPWLSPWPEGHAWAFVLSHDVETTVGYQNVSPLRDLERHLGYRSSWNFVPMRYAVEDGLVAKLVDDGFEVGVHGLYHDGHDLRSLATLRERLPAIHQHAERWRAAGFRSPATHRTWEWMPLLGFDYDSSYPDTDPFEPQPGGCCSWLPYFNQDLVELPITLPQDHTLFVILGQPDERVWIHKAEHLKDQGGMALLVTHPDYLLERSRLEAYRRVLERFAADTGAWRALPREVSAWWRRRAASRLEPTAGGWRVAGPAAHEGHIVHAVPPDADVLAGPRGPA